MSITMTTTTWMLFLVIVCCWRATRVVASASTYETRYVSPNSYSSSSSSSSTRGRASGRKAQEMTTSDDNNNNNNKKKNNPRTNYAMINAGSAFFEPVKIGWDNKCRDLNLNCQYFVSPDEDCPTIQIGILRELALQNETLGGIAMAPCYPEIVSPVMRSIVEESNIPVVTYDTDGLPESKRAAYVGTDNRFLGVTMANVLKQLRPEGGTFAIIGGGERLNVNQRAEGFREEITKYNDREDKAHWHELDGSPLVDLGTDIMNAQHIADRNPTAIVTVYQSPMRSTNWTHFIDTNRHRNITFVGSDGSGYQIDYLNRRYVDGLVGQLPYDMGRVSLEVLHELETTGSIEKDFYPTNLVSYTLIPLELPPLNLNQHLLGGLVIVGYTCFGIAVLSALACLSWTVYFRTSLVVRAAQPFFLFMVAGGIIILASTLIPLSFDDDGDPESMTTTKSIAICQSIPWLAFTGFALTFSSLFMKTWRVNRLFHGKTSHSRVRVDEKDVLLPFVIVLTSNIVVLIVWTVLDPLTYTRELGEGTDYWNRVISTYGACRSHNVAPYLITLAVINLSVIIIALWQAYNAKDIKSEFSEAKYIGLSVSSLLQGFLTGLPILIIVKDTPEAFYLVLTLIIFLLCMAVLLLIFLPKIFMHRKYSGMSEADQKRELAASIQRSSATFSNCNFTALAHSQGTTRIPERQMSPPSEYSVLQSRSAFYEPVSTTVSRTANVSSVVQSGTGTEESGGEPSLPTTTTVVKPIRRMSTAW